LIFALVFEVSYKSGSAKSGEICRRGGKLRLLASHNKKVPKFITHMFFIFYYLNEGKKKLEISCFYDIFFKIRKNEY